MTDQNRISSISLPAAADLSSSQFRIVTVDSNGRAALSNATALSFGVLQNKPGSLQAATVAFEGVTKVVAGAAITAGARVRSDANAAAVPAAVAGNAVIGIALESAGAAGDIIKVFLTRMPFAALA
jgi:hypothetical protein